jgi:ABC-type nitrate/sulfonate/bicarbonate transport system permease component
VSISGPLRRRCLGVLGTATFLGSWWLVSSTYVGGGGGTVPSPLVVLQAAVSLLQDDAFWEATAVTLQRGFAGLSLALALSVIVALLLTASRVVNAALEPLISLAYPVPRIALYSIAVAALGIGALPQISIVVVECVFPLTVTIYAGLRSIDKNLIWMARNAGAGIVVASFVILRMALPTVFTGLRIAAPLMLTLTVAAQMFTGSADGLGYLIQLSSSRLITADIFAIAILIGILGYVTDRVIVLLDQWTSRHLRRVAM